MKGNVIQMNTLHLNSVRLNGIGKVQSVSLKGGSTEDPVFPPVEPPVEPTPTYTISASVTNGKVSATRNGSAVNLPYTANEGDTIVVEVTPNDGYAFEGWADGNTDNPRTITMTADVVLSAQCVEVVVPPVGNYIQFEDPAVEAICVANWSSDGIGLTEEDAAAVTSIGTTFRGNKEITSFNEFRYFTGVTFLSTTTSTNAGAFEGCSALESICLPSSVTTIGDYSFSQCSALKVVGGMDNVATIMRFAFNESGMEELNLPSCTIIRTSIAPNSQIKRIIAPSLQKILGSLIKVYNLELLDVGAELNEIEAYSFWQMTTGKTTFICRATTPAILGGSNNMNFCSVIYVPDASLEAYKTAVNWSAYADRIHPLSEIEGSPYIQFEDAEVERVLMANGVSSDGIGITKEDAAAVTSISTWFKGNTAITSFNELQYFTGMPSIPKNAFMGCANLKSCKIPDSVTEIGNDAFASSGIESIVANGVVKINAASFNACSYLTSVDIPNAQYINGLDDKYGAFNNCTSLRYVNMPNARTIDSTSFTRCPIENDQILLNLETLGKDVFNYAQFGKLVAPKLKTIGNTSFSKCDNLEVMLLRDIESIAGYSNFETFRDCTKLKHFICLAQSVPSLATNVFRGTPINDGTGAIYVLDEKVDAYKSAANWSAFANVIKPYSQLATDNPTLYAEIQQYL